MKNSEIIWTGSPDDMTAISGEYVLRVEDMGQGVWWFVYFKDEQIDQGMKNTADLAKSAAINAMKEHLKKK